MSSPDPNIAMVELIAGALGDLRRELLFVGGCAAGLMITDSGRGAIRATTDVDLVAQVTGHGDYYALAERLTGLGFKEDQDVICRWLVQGIKVDVMPTDEKILGFSNRWYDDAMRCASDVRLPNGMSIRLITPPLLVATKIEAFHSRGNRDYQGSHDLEDIISVVDGRPELLKEITDSGESIRSYLEAEIDDLLANPRFTDSIAYHLRPDAASQARVAVVISRLRKIAGV